MAPSDDFDLDPKKVEKKKVEKKKVEKPSKIDALIAAINDVGDYDLKYVPSLATSIRSIKGNWAEIQEEVARAKARNRD